jgi:hypothetical protein
VASSLPRGHNFGQARSDSMLLTDLRYATIEYPM